MKFKVTLTRVYEIDTDRDWKGDCSALNEALLDNGVEPGEADRDDIADGIRTMLDQDIESVADLSEVDSMDFEIEVPDGTTFTVTPADEEE